MSTVTKALLENVEMKLRAAKAQYKIIMPDGTEAGELEIAKKLKRGPGTAPRGSYINAFREKLNGLAVGDIAEFTPKEQGLNYKAFASALSAAAVNKFGAGNAMIATDKIRETVEIMRLK